MIKALFTLLFIHIASLGYAQDNDRLLESAHEQKIFSDARKLFENKKFNESIIEYSKISKKSDRYFLALEEKAWAYMHLQQYDKVLAETRTLTSPVITNLIGAEPFLLQALAQLKICDYVSVFQTLKEFKSLKRNQISAIQDIAKKKSNAVSKQVLQTWMINVDDWKQIGPQLGMMPQLFYHDIVMVRAAKAKNMTAMEKRLQELAVQENNENFRILQKLNLIEVESVQRVHIATEFNRKQGETVEKNSDNLVFKDSNEVWLDELDSYQATVNRCKQKTGRTM